MVKIIMLIKKRPDLTRAEFINYHNEHHIPFMHQKDCGIWLHH